MIHSEWNNTDGPARAYIFVYPTDPLPPTASFDAIRDSEAPRDEPAAGVLSKRVVERGDKRLHGDLRELADSSLTAGATLTVRIDSDETALVFVVDGAVAPSDGESALEAEHTLLAPPAPEPRELMLTTREPSRVLHAVMGEGLGLRLREG